MNQPDSSTEEAELSKKERILLELDEQQSLLGAWLGGLGMSILAIGFCYPLAVTFKQPLGFYSVFMGIMVAFGVRNWGRGLDRRFSAIGVAFTGLCLILGTLLTELILLVHTSRHDLGDYLAEMNFDYAWNLIATRLGFMPALLWLIALVLGYRGSIRKLERRKLTQLRGED